MGQNVRKKKGRPPKADSGARKTPGMERGLRRSLRRRNVKYVFDLDDYFDDDEVFESDEDHRRKAKKLKLLLNLQSGGELESTAPEGSWSRRVDHALNESASLSKNGGKPSKIREIKNEIDEDINDPNDDVSDGDNKQNDAEDREKKPKPIAEGSSPGTPTEAPSGLPLPDKRALELILNKLQKKDIYGVYAEPVDPEELPDYHDVIKHPMDFATVRNKLRSGSYETMEQFEHDVFLICSNAMQYNTLDTIYHKQAHSIKELAVKKFYKIRLNAECSEKDVNPDQKMRSSTTLKKRIMSRSVRETVQEPLGTDFSSGATLVTAFDIHHVSNVLQAVGFQRPGNGDVLVEGNSFLNDNLDVGEESRIEKGPLSRFGTKLLVQDENRRVTYSPSLAHLVESSESMFSTFLGESRQLVPVGLYSDNSYARSLARFAATLGSVAWEVTSKRIEQALPQGFKYGRGWVGDYESLPTPVLMLENCTVKEPPFFAKVQPAADPGRFENVPTVTFSSKESPGTGLVSGNNLPFLVPTATTPSAPSIIASPAVKQTTRQSVSVKPSRFLSPRMKPRGSANLGNQHQKTRFRTSVESDKKIFKQFEFFGSTSFRKKAAEPNGRMQISRHSETEASNSMEFTSRNINFSPFDNKGVAAEGLPNDEVVCNRSDNNTASPSSDLAKAASYKPYEQSDPVQLMRMLAEKSQNQQISLNQSPINASSQLLSSAPSSISNDSSLAALYAARAWMSVGAGGFGPAGGNINRHKNQINSDSLCNSTRDIQPQMAQFPGDFPSSGGMHVRSDRISSPFHAFAPQGLIPVRFGNEIQFHNEPTVYPHLASADLSRFPMHSTWWNLSPPMSSKLKQESLPPELNIDFQSSVSPGDGRPSSLALQLRHFI